MCLEIVNQYIYLGILLTEHLDYMKMANHVSKAASRALGLVIARNKSFGGLPFGFFQKLFDSMAWSVISYGAAIWRNRQFSCISSVQLRAAKFYMGMGRYTPNSAVHGDTGWKPTLVRQWLSVTSQWLQLKNMDTNRLNRKIFECAERNGNGRCQNWNYRVNKTLAEAGISYEPGVTNSRMLKAILSAYLYSVKKVMDHCKQWTVKCLRWGRFS